jgi:hypothetical protein
LITPFLFIYFAAGRYKAGVGRLSVPLSVIIQVRPVTWIKLEAAFSPCGMGGDTDSAIPGLPEDMSGVTCRYSKIKAGSLQSLKMMIFPLLPAKNAYMPICKGWSY